MIINCKHDIFSLDAGYDVVINVYNHQNKFSVINQYYSTDEFYVYLVMSKAHINYFVNNQFWL